MMNRVQDKKTITAIMTFFKKYLTGILLLEVTVFFSLGKMKILFG